MSFSPWWKRTALILLFAGMTSLLLASVPPSSSSAIDGGPITLIAADDTWRYFKGTQEPPWIWNYAEFNESQWLSSPGGFGYVNRGANPAGLTRAALGENATVLADMQGSYVTLYVRKKFKVADPTMLARVLLTVDYDDGFIAYINGTEVARSGMPLTGVHHDTPSLWSHEASRGTIDPQPPEVFDVSGAIRSGTNALAIEVHNRHIDNIDLSLLASLTAYQIPMDQIVSRTRPGDSWHYLKGTSEPPPTWKARVFDDSSWQLGPSGFGYGESENATVLSDMQGQYLTVYARHAFTIDHPEDVKTLLFGIDYDDGFVAYLNGTEILKQNVAGDPPAFDTPALEHHGSSTGDGTRQPAERYDISALTPLLVAGRNIIAVEGHNSRVESTGFSLVPSLILIKALPLDPVLVQQPYLQAPSADGVTIVWGTKGYGRPTVQYGVTDLAGEAAGTSTFIDALGGYYRNQVALMGLQQGQRYKYRILLDSAPIDSRVDLFFDVAPPPNTSFFTFGVVGDMGTSSERQQRVRDRMRAGLLDLLIITGDVDETHGTYEDYQRNFFGMYRSLLSHMPSAPTIGNSEYWPSTRYYNADGSEKGLAFHDMFVLPANGPGKRDQFYFSFDYGNIHFVGLDTENIGPDQVQWLDDDLSKNKLPWTIVYFHRPPFDDAKDHPITEGGVHGARAAFVPTMERYRVDLVFAGHNALYARTQPLINGRNEAPYADITTEVKGGIVYVTTGGGGDVALDFLNPDQFHQAPGAYAPQYHYVRVTVADCVLGLQAIDMNGQVLDNYIRDKCG